LANGPTVALIVAAALIAFGHFAAFYALVAALVLELALIGERMSVEAARRVRRADRIAGVAALLVLGFGLLRVFLYEKGSAYYFSNTWFLVKLALFVVAALVSIYPTVRFIRWGRELARDTAPMPDPVEVRWLRRAIHWELVLIGGILFCASLMAKGFGS